MNRTETEPDLADGELEILDQIALASAACRDLNVHRSVLLSLTRRGYLKSDYFILTKKSLDALAREWCRDAPTGISQDLIAHWRTLRGQGRTSAVGEYTPEEFWTLLDAYESLRGTAGAAESSEPQPLDLVLHCPECHTQHVDEPDERTPAWLNPPHRSHLCHACGIIWRPADVPTNGVREIKTRGKADTWPDLNLSTGFCQLDDLADVKDHGVTDDDGNLLVGQRADGSPIWIESEKPLPLQRVAHFTEGEARCKAWELAGAGYGPTGIAQLHHSGITGAAPPSNDQPKGGA